jgi:hypothetical protein
LLNEFALYVNYVNQVGVLWIGVWKRYFSTVQGASKTNGKGKRYLVFIWMKTSRLVA